MKEEEGVNGWMDGWMGGWRRALFFLFMQEGRAVRVEGRLSHARHLCEDVMAFSLPSLGSKLHVRWRTKDFAGTLCSSDGFREKKK